MHRAIVAALALTLQACSARIDAPPFPASLKDTPTKPDVAPARVIHPATIAPPVVVGGTQEQNERLSRVLYNALADAGHDMQPQGSYRVIGRIENSAVTWEIVGPEGRKGSVTQSTTSTWALQAIVPGVLSHLPKPSTPI